MNGSSLSKTLSEPASTVREADLEAERVAAARASLGTSGDPIYQMALRTIEGLGLGGHALDFGAGTGTLSRLLCERDAFHSVTAADLVSFPEAQAHSKLRWLHADLNRPLSCENSRFDVIAAIEVIEHLENPRAVVRECFRLLRPGGVLLLSTPNNESWRALIALAGRGHFVDFGDASYPAHITALVRRDLVRICREAGFETPRFVFSDHGTLPKLTRFTWQKLSRGRLRGLRYSNNLLCIARKPEPTS